MIAGISVLVGIAVGLAVILVVVSRNLATEDQSVADQIEQCLPRIQCAQCGFPGCRPYAEAISAGKTDINRCPPGGDRLIRELAVLLGREPLPLAAELGRANMDQVALINEAACIGCNLCARACPVDAIVGVPQYMHTVISTYCTGCELCLPPCPVDCIDLVKRNA
jgi:electron transport complex protein RnfB